MGKIPELDETSSLTPCPEDIEAACLGCLIAEPGKPASQFSRLTLAQVYDRTIYSATETLPAAGKRPEPVLLTEWLRGHGQLENAGGLSHAGRQRGLGFREADLAALIAAV